MTKTAPELSIVIPAYNEGEGIELFHKKYLKPHLSKYKHEIVYVNDGSSDDTLEKLIEIAKNKPNIKIVDLSRNFGKEIAVTAGMSASEGDVVIVLDADGQHPPEMIPKFIEKWRDGYQVVVGVRNLQESEGFIKTVGSKLFYQLFNRVSGNQIVPRSTDYRLIDREVKDAFISISETNRITRGLIDWLGFNRSYVYFDSPKRIAGKASYSTKQLFKLAINSFISLSLRPLFLFGQIGLFMVILSGSAGLFIFIEQLMLGDPLGLNITGSAMLGVLISFLVGLILISQSMLAIYIARIYQESQGRPLYVVNKKTSYNIKR